MRQARRHVDEVPRFQQMRLAGEREFAGARQDLDHGMLSRSVLGQLLSLREAEQHDS